MELQVLPRGQLVVEGRVLEDDADRLAHRVLLGGDVEAVERGLPEVGLSSVQSMLIVVVLPAPLGPRKPKISLWPMSKLTSSTAVKPLNLRVRSVDADDRSRRGRRGACALRSRLRA